IRCAKRNLEEYPAYRIRDGSDNRAWSNRADSHAIVFRRIRHVYDVAAQLLLLALTAREIQNIVAVDVFLIETIISDGAIDSRIAEQVDERESTAAGWEVGNGSDLIRPTRERLVHNKDWIG